MPGLFNLTDSGARKLAIASLLGIANAAGSGAGASVTTPVAVVDQFGNGQLPANYSVAVMPSQPAFASVTSRTTSGFDVVLTPISSGVTLSAGSFDLQLIG